MLRELSGAVPARLQVLHQTARARLAGLPPAPPTGMLPTVGGYVVIDSPNIRSARARLRGVVHPWDAAIVAIAVTLGCVTLTFPFGRDQGAFFFIGRQWLHGLIPYRDTFDNKTPLIYLIHAATIAVLGEHMWAIRAVEIVWVLLLGWFVGTTLATRGGPPLPGVRGVAVLSFTLLYLCTLNYWDSAQAEVWYAGLAMLSLWAAERIERRSLAAVIAGVLSGTSLLAKPPALPMLLPAIAAVAERGFRTDGTTQARLAVAVRVLALFVAGATVPIAFTLFYFAAVGALPALIDVTIYANLYYAGQSGAQTSAEVVDRLIGFAREFHPLVMLGLLMLLVGFVVAIGRRSYPTARRYCLAALLLAGAIAAVVWQRKFFRYHYGAILIALGYVFVTVADDAARQFPQWLRRPASGPIVAAAIGAAVLAAFTSVVPASNRYTYHAVRAIEHLQHRVSDREFCADFALPELSYDWTSNVAVGAWLANNSLPSDEVVVRGFEPGIYAVAHRWTCHRFFFTSWLIDPRRNYHRAEWLREDLDGLKRRPPRYIVVLNEVREGIDSPAYITPLGYRERFRYRGLSVLERSPPPTDSIAAPSAR